MSWPLVGLIAVLILGLLLLVEALVARAQREFDEFDRCKREERRTWRDARSAEELSAVPRIVLPEILWDVLQRLRALEGRR